MVPNTKWQQPLHNDSLAKQVFQTLKDAIFSGDLAPGDAIREMHVAKSMQVSQATVREALVMLQQTGLVVREPNRRTIVTEFSRQEILDRLAMRAALEQLAAVEASKHLTSEEIGELEVRASAIDRKIDARESLEHVQADMHFHHYVWERCGNSVLKNTLEMTTTPLFAFMSVLMRAGMVDLQESRPHQRITEAIASGNAGMIELEIRMHMEASYQSFLKTGLPSLDALAHAAGAGIGANGLAHVTS